jgi:hypothetical protein
MFKIFAQRASVLVQPSRQLVSGPEDFLEVQGAHANPLNFRDSTYRHPFFYNLGQRLESFPHRTDDVPLNDGVYFNLIAGQSSSDEVHDAYFNCATRHDGDACGRYGNELIDSFSYCQRIGGRAPSWRDRLRIDVWGSSQRHQTKRLDD